MVDLVKKEIRDIEKEIDDLHKLNPLITQNFPTSCWNFLAVYEDRFLMQILNQNDPMQIEKAIYTDNLLFCTKYAIEWIFKNCPQANSFQPIYSEQFYENSNDLFNMAEDYDSFVSAFSLASRGILELNEQNGIISEIYKTKKDYRYMYYGFLIRTRNSIRDMHGFKTNEKFLQTIDKYLLLEPDRFRYKLSKRLFSESRKYLASLLITFHEFPDNWSFANWNVNEFRAMYGFLFTWSFIHFNSRILASLKGCRGMGILDGIIIVDTAELPYMLANFSNVSIEKAKLFINTFTYGEMGIKSPDPVLQPIIRITKSEYAISPNLIINNSFERNYSILLNRIPEEKSRYSILINGKEAIMRKKIIMSLGDPSLSYYSGKNPLGNSIPDIDLAIISKEEKLVVFIELKWFIDPAEVREVIEKSEEISKGISQLKKIREAILLRPQKIIDILSINNDFDFSYILISDNFIGEFWVQDKDIPVIQIDHFLDQYKCFHKLRKTNNWVVNREYLPVKGRDFLVSKEKIRMGKWILLHDMIKPVSDTFLE